MKRPGPDAATPPDQALPGAQCGESAQPSTHLSQLPPNIPDHELICRIGGGSYGDVWLAKNKLGTLHEVKVVYRRTFDDSHPFESEFHGIQKFEPISRSHEGLVDSLQVGGTDQYFYYVMELADDGSESRLQPETATEGPARRVTCRPKAPARRHVVPSRPCVGRLLVGALLGR